MMSSWVGTSPHPGFAVLPPAGEEREDPLPTGAQRRCAAILSPLERRRVGGARRGSGRGGGARAAASSWLNLAARAEPVADVIVGGNQPPSRLRRTSPCGGRKRRPTSHWSSATPRSYVCPPS